MSDSSDLFAAIDLGSNSFHMLVVQHINGTPRVIAKVKRKVRLAAGLDHHNRLSITAMERGWQCLALFAERLSDIPAQNIKIVSTATLRLATNAQEFTARADQILGQPINIISGEQEAELIYHGMAVSSDGTGTRLIVDIGGASTELILGQGFSPMVLNSLNMGCVTWLERYFPDGALSRANFERAINGAAAVLAPIKNSYLAHQWQLSLGASGSIQAVQEVLQAQELNEQITLDKLEHLLAQTIACGTQQQLEIKGLKKDRKPVFASGLAILIMLFRELSLGTMVASGGALREGLIAQLIEQPQVDDLRLQTTKQLQQQFCIDQRQANSVVKVAMALAQQVSPQWSVLDNEGGSLLTYSAMLHEIGLSLNYLRANDCGYFLLAHCAMPGFSKEQQKLISGLVANYKNPIQHDILQQQAWCKPELAQQLTLLLRLAVIIAGRYQEARIADITLVAATHELQIVVSKQLQQSNPLLMAELTQEVNDSKVLSLIIS